jgi:hypothetical protein
MFAERSGWEPEIAGKNFWELALWTELASHKLPDPVFWEAGPNQTSS